MINVATIVGRLGHDLELRQTPNGLNVINFRIACSEYYKDSNGNKQERTNWIRCNAFGRLAELLNQYVKKGDRIGISGSLTTKAWLDKHGQKRLDLEIRVADIMFLESKNGNASREAVKSEEEQVEQEPDMIPF